MKKKVVSLLLCLSTVALLVGCKTTTTEEPKNIQSEPEVVSEVVEPESEIVEEEVVELPTIEEAMTEADMEDLLTQFDALATASAIDSRDYYFNDDSDLDLDTPYFLSQYRETIEYDEYASGLTMYSLKEEDGSWTNYYNDEGTWFKKTNDPYDMSFQDGITHTVAEGTELAIVTYDGNQYLSFDAIELYPEDTGWEPATYTLLYAYNDEGNFVFAGTVNPLDMGDTKMFLKLYDTDNLETIELPEEALEATEATDTQFAAFWNKFNQ